MQKLCQEGFLDMRKLAQLPVDELIAALAILTDDYGVWIAEEKAKASFAELQNYADVANEALNHCDEILLRLREGLACLQTNPLALDAFRFANQVMADQRVHSIYALSKRRLERTQISDFDIPKNHSWRPFQLAFI